MKSTTGAERGAGKSVSIDGRWWLQVAVIITAGLLIYVPVLRGGWVWDDIVLVTSNASLRTVHGLWDIWFSAPVTDYWPLTWTLLWAEWHLWGGEPPGYHVTSLTLHLCSGFLIWRLLHRLGLRFGWLGGLLFVIHPLAVESVAWVSEIKNTLSLPLYLLSLDAWLDTEEKKPGGYLRSVLFYLAAMLAKTSTVMLPAVILLYCWWKRGRISGQEMKRMIPYGVIALVLGLVTIYFQTNGHDEDPVDLGGPFTRLIGAGTAFLFYLGKFVLPVNLLPIYPRWTLDPPSFLQLLTLPALAILFFGLWTQRRDWGRHALFGLGFFLLNALPVLGLTKMRYMSVSWVADHFAYLPMIGLVGLVVAGGGQLLARARSSGHFSAVGVISILLALLTWQSHSYANQFFSDETLWTYTLQYNPLAAQAHYNLGNDLMQAGRSAEAVGQFEETVKIDPNYAPAYNNLGSSLVVVGRLPEAVQQYEEAVKIEPDLAVAHNNLGDVLRQVGRVQEAMEQYRLAVKFKPDYADAHNNLGRVMGQSGRVPEAIEQFRLAVKFDPDLAEAYNNLGVALKQSGRLPEAMEQYEKALAINPDYADAHFNLANDQWQTGHLPEAMEQYEEVLKINPEYVPARNNLSRVQQALQQAVPANH